MATLSELIQVTADSLGLERGGVWKCGRVLREAGLLPTGRRGPGGSAEVTADHAAVLLLGVWCSPTYAHAPHAVEAFGALPVVSAARHRREEARQVVEVFAIEDLPIFSGGGEMQVALTRSLRSAVAFMIEWTPHLETAREAGDVPDVEWPETLTAVRDLSLPRASFTLPVLAEPDVAGIYLCAPSPADASPDARLWRGGLELEATIPGSAVRAIGRLLGASDETLLKYAALETLPERARAAAKARRRQPVQE